MGIELPYLILTLLGLAAVGYCVRASLRRLGVPPVVSLMALGMGLSAAPVAILPEVWLDHRPLLSYAAFVLLLLRAGLMISTETARKIVIPAIVFGTIPVIGELFVVFGLSRWLLFDHLGICLLAAFIVAAVSPAVILPIMIDLRERNCGTARMVPERIIGITVLNAFIAQTGILITLNLLAPEVVGQTEATRLLLLPFAVVGGLLLGGVVAWLTRIEWLYSDQQPKLVKKGSLLAALVAFIAALAVYFLSQRIGTESVLATLALGVTLRHRIGPRIESISKELRKFWSLAEIVLFVNIGSYIDFALLWSGPVVFSALVVVVGALLARVWIANVLIKRTILTSGEQRYTVLAQIPKATIQAVFGAMPLAIFTTRGQHELIADGQVIVVLAAVAIIATAPLGAVTLERQAERLLQS